MIKQAGRVVAVEIDCLWVETLRQSTCNSCSVQKGCGHGLLNSIGTGRRHHIRVLLGDLSANDFALDDDVEVGIPDDILVSGALLVYLFPLLMMLAFSMLASYWWGGDVVALIGAVTGFMLGFAGVRLHAWLNRNNTELQPFVVAKSDPDQISALEFANPSVS